ncbi:SDR family oxidoreductase [Candidatus Palauibacter sp.]|uniref:SDR family oxidoreductase n=1 Tax=Candidatus Palauibacter sp. TaxID=3101350 RepID=UPI003CC5CBB3
MDFGIEDRVALVAASSQGLGRAVAEELAAEGTHLVMCARGEEALAEAVASADGRGPGEVLGIPVDLSEPAQVAALAEAALDRFGRVDILVNNAGGPPAGPFEAHDAAAWQAAVRLNLESALQLTRAVLPGMKERGWGRILNITSIAVKEPVDGLILSNSVRAAVTGFAKSLSNEVAAFGVTVNNVLPGFTRTARLDELAAVRAEAGGISTEEVEAGWNAAIPAGRLGEAREFAAVVAFLASERASYVTGVSVAVDGGRTRALY